jgi:predicted Zn-dependent protease
VTAIRAILVKQGLLPPGEGEQPPAPPQPDPETIANAQHKQAQAKLADAKAQEIIAKTPGQIQETEAKTAETVAKIPGHEAAGHATIIQNGQAIFPMMAPKGAPVQPMPNLSDDYNGGYPQ